jgi:PAS domain-containing protein
MNRLITSNPDDRDYRQLYRLLVEDLKDFAIFAIDPDGRATSWNSGVERILGYSEAEFIGLLGTRRMSAGIGAKTGSPSSSTEL